MEIGLEQKSTTTHFFPSNAKQQEKTMPINGWKVENNDRNDYLFKLNRSTKSSSVLVNCLQSMLFHFVDGD